MKKAVAALMAFCFVALPAFGVPPNGVSFVEELQVFTATPPTTSSTTGVSLSKAVGYQITASAQSGEVITGGFLDCYYRPEKRSRWLKCNSAMDITLRTGYRDSTTTQYETLVGMSRVKYVPRAVTSTYADAGTVYTVDGGFLDGGSFLDILYEVGQK